MHPLILPGRRLAEKYQIIDVPTIVGSGARRTGRSNGQAMSHLGQTRTSPPETVRSALPPRADIVRPPRNVRFVPLAEVIRSSSPRASTSSLWSCAISYLGGKDWNELKVSLMSAQEFMLMLNTR